MISHDKIFVKKSITVFRKQFFPSKESDTIRLQQGFPTFKISYHLGKWVPHLVNTNHLFQNNWFDWILVYSKE